jgi:hypothetical protein
MKYPGWSAAVFLAYILLPACQQSRPTGAAPIWQSGEYTLYADSVVQGRYTARALSHTQLASNYQSLANAFQDPRIMFKFSLNGKDNELPPGQDNVFLALPAAAGATLETPLIPFGQRYVDPRPAPVNTYLAPNTRLKIRLDLRPVLAAFKKDGFYTMFKGDKLYQQDFKQVFIAGSASPLSWDFDNLINKPELEMKDADGDGIYEVTLVLNQPGGAQTTAQQWKKTINTADFPQYSSDYPLTDALYNLALEEARRAVEPDSTFRTGKEWAGVWTRDVSYSIILAQASLQPKVAMNSLLRKVSPNGRIIQDTGTGGAYPCSTDRLIWATAAWEIYQATGDKAWLRKVFPIIKQSIADDVQNAYDPVTGLVRGESSFLDWREQTYPRWMQPVDIYQSENLGTNAVHYQANIVLAQMAAKLGQPVVAAEHQRLATGIKQGLNQHLWQADKGYYGQYLYGRTHLVLSPRAEALGEALCVLFGIAEGERAQQVVSKTPTTPYGISCIYPQIPGLPPYHNDAVWPFVQSFWALAAARAGNEASLTESMAAIYRPAALFLTDKENFVADNGDFAGTQINSSNMLWSLSGSLSLVYKVLFGIEYQGDHLVFRPFVPQTLQGHRQLTGFRYRKAILDVEMDGFGNIVQRITLDGQPLPNAAIPTGLAGRHAIRITLKNQAPAAQPTSRVAVVFSPETPSLTYQQGRLQWTPIAGATAYKLLRDGKLLSTSSATGVAVPAAGATYQVIAVGAGGWESFASEPLMTGPAEQVQLETLAPKSSLAYQGFTGSGFVEISPSRNTRLTIPLTVTEPGLYALDFRYSNGNGPINTQNKCAIRTLRRGTELLGTVVLPQRGVGEWSNWGFSNPILVHLAAGTHSLTLAYESANQNMNGLVNQAMLDCLRLQRVQ